MFSVFIYLEGTILCFVLCYFKLYDPFLWMGFNCLKAVESLRGDSSLLTKLLGGPRTHLIAIG